MVIPAVVYIILSIAASGSLFWIVYTLSEQISWFLILIVVIAATVLLYPLFMRFRNIFKKK
jgi:hypothetical protein